MQAGIHPGFEVAFGFLTGPVNIEGITKVQGDAEKEGDLGFLVIGALVQQLIDLIAVRQSLFDAIRIRLPLNHKFGVILCDIHISLFINPPIYFRQS